MCRSQSRLTSKFDEGWKNSRYPIDATAESAYRGGVFNHYIDRLDVENVVGSWMLVNKKCIFC